MTTETYKKSCLIVYDVGSTYTKAVMFSRATSRLTYVGSAQAPTTVDDVTIGIQNAKYNLFNNKTIPKGTITEEYATSSAAGGLRMVAMGYMPRVTAKAAKEVAMTAGAKVLEIISYEQDPAFKVEVLKEIDPDIILLAGGTDGGNEESLMEHAFVIINSNVDAVVVIAGNAFIQPKVQDILENNNLKTVRVPNVMPTIHKLNAGPSRQAIHGQFISQLIQAKGMGKLIEAVTDRQVIPTPGAVLIGAELLATGTRLCKGLGDLLVVDIGGATTDIHSVLPSLGEVPKEELGLIVNNVKQISYRTVEGNLGMRVSAGGVLDTVGPTVILNKVGLCGCEKETELVKYITYLEKNPDYVSTLEEEQLFDEGIAITAIEIALKRHAGYLSQEYMPVLGVTPGTPVGRDLRNVRLVIGVGGVFTHASREKANRIMAKALENIGFSLLPKEPMFMFDKEYLFYALGAVGQKYPNEVFDFAYNYIRIFNQ